MKSRIGVILIAVALVAACKKAPAQAQKPAGSTATPNAAAAPAAVKPVPAQLPDVLARVNGAPIDRGEFERAVQTIEAQAGGPVPAERRNEIYRQLLDQLVALQLLSQDAVANKIDVPQSEVDSRVAQIRSQFPNEQAFTAALAERRMTPDGLKADIRRQMLAMKLVDTQIAPTIKVTDAEVQDFYAKNPDKFQEPEAVHVAHILIRTPENADAAAKKKARAEAEGVLAQLKKGADFATLAKQHSQDPGSAANGGDLGFVPRGQTVPAFEQAAFGLKPGQLSGLVESPYGFHIIKMIAHRDGRKVPLQEVKAQVEQYLKQQKMQEATQALVQQLKAMAKIEILI